MNFKNLHSLEIVLNADYTPYYPYIPLDREENE